MNLINNDNTYKTMIKHYILSLLIISCDTAVAPPNPVTLINFGIKPNNITL